MDGKEPRGRPSKEWASLSMRSKRRRIEEEVVMSPLHPPALQTSAAQTRSPAQIEDEVVVAGSEWDLDKFLDIDPLLVNSDCEGAEPEPPNPDSIASDPQCLQAHKSSGSSISSNECHSEDEELLNVKVLGILHYDCDECIGCQCINCDTCAHFDNVDCVHCHLCLSSDRTDDASWDIAEDDNTDNESKEIDGTDDDEILSKEDSLNKAMKSDFIDLALKNKLTHTAVTDLCVFFRKYEIGNFPKTAKTLLQTVDVVPLREVPPGHYWHNGITGYLLKCATQTGCSVIEVKFRIDGVPLFKSVNSSFWVLSCLLNDDPEVCLIGLYLGNEKPKDSNDFLKDFVEEVAPLCRDGFNANGKITNVRVSCRIFDAPATSFALNTKYFNAYFGCFKCTTEGELIGNTMSYPELNAPLRTDESFANQEQSLYHKGRTILEDIPGFGCVTSVPLDYMHLLLLGLMRKLMYMWISGPLHVRVGSNQVTEISNLLVGLIGWVPLEFTRRTLRTLQHVRRFKATEFRLILLHIGIVIFNKMPRRLYEHFLVFNVLTTIFVDRSFCRSRLQYARELCVYFVESFIDLYGRQYVSHNVHSLIHLADDVAQFGPLDDFSAFPFENFYQFFGTIIRKGEKPLQQAAKRYLELEASGSKPFCSVKPQTNTAFRGGGRHSQGILLESCVNPQFSTLTIPGGCTISIQSEADKCCVFENGSIVVVHNFASKSSGEIVVIGREFLEWEDVNTTPCKSSLLGIKYVRKLSKLKVFPASQITRKCFRMPWKAGFVVVPLHKH